MTTTDSGLLFQQVHIVASDWTFPADLIADLRAANPAADAECGRVWFLQLGPVYNRAAPAMAVGLRGEVGGLEWIDFDHGGRFVPVDGLNEDWAGCSIIWNHDQGMAPYAELPVQRVLDAVEEYARTGQQPTCMQWQPADD